MRLNYTAKIKKAVRPKNPVKIIVHFNKQQSLHDLPWTVHIRGVCIPARIVSWCGVTPKTIWKPEKLTNPRGWIECTGRVELSKDDAVTIVGTK